LVSRIYSLYADSVYLDCVCSALYACGWYDSLEPCISRFKGLFALLRGHNDLIVLARELS